MPFLAFLVSNIDAISLVRFIYERVVIGRVLKVMIRIYSSFSENFFRVSTSVFALVTKMDDCPAGKKERTNSEFEAIFVGNQRRGKQLQARQPTEQRDDRCLSTSNQQTSLQ